MNEREIKIQAAKTAARENNRSLERAQEAALTSEAYIINYQKQIERLKKEHKLRVADLQARLDRQIENAKTHHATIDELIINKEAIHEQLKSAIHLGESQCEYCGRYFTPAGLPRHQASCSAKPDAKIIEKHETELKESKEDLEAKKAELQRQLADLENLSKAE
jgi:hypothetical protein